MRAFKKVLAATVLLVCFGYGVIVGAYKWFPFNLISNIKREVSSFIDVKPNLDKEANIAPKAGYWNVFNSKAPTSSISKEKLNNFVFSWTQINDSNIIKTAAIKYENNNILFINQDDFEILSSFGLTSENITKNGGVKSVFEFNKKTIAYIAYIKNNCASAELVSLTSKKVLFDLGCIDPTNADLNGVGGGHLILNDHEFLLTTGTPTTSHVDNAINQNAQDDQSYWGKILKFEEIGDSFNVSIYSKGHRNPQGIFASKGKVYSVEHGPRGGDEINEIIEGNNYGWPNQSFGSEYDLKMINKSFEGIQNYMDPLYVFLPSIGISHINECPKEYAAFYKPYDCLAVSSMKAGSIFFIVFTNNKVLFSERIDLGSRIRKFVVAENKIVAVTDHKGVIVGEIKPLK